MIANTRILAKCLIAGALLIHAGGLQSQTSSSTASQGPSRENEERLAQLEKQVDGFRTQLKIPGLSAVVIKDQEVLWAKGFGHADLENRIAATPDTLYHIASLTKTFAATLVMQLVEQGKLDLDEPVSHYSSDFKDDSVRIKHLLSHTLGGAKPGDQYRYDGGNYDYVTAIIEKKTGKSFRELMVKTFLDPLAMSSSVPGHDVVDEPDKWIPLLGKENLDRYARNLTRLAQPYTLYGASEIIHVPYPPKDINGAAGLLSTVLDMARYDAAIDRHVYLKKETQERAWTNFVSNAGQRLPHGLGWFVTDYQGVRLIWHFGHWGVGFSAIYLKVPARNLSFILLANSEALSDHQFQGSEDVTDNVFACAFLRLFDVAPSDANDCERSSQAALAKWSEHRRAQARVAVQLDPAVLEAYVGQYKYEGEPRDRIYTVTREGGRLFVDLPRNYKTEMFAESESKFFLKIMAVQVTFTREAGEVTGIDLVANDTETWSAKRIK
jgi:CubicO group peptidase (beta-lactamase class C family)